jgi:hypothetical protein
MWRKSFRWIPSAVVNTSRARFTARMSACCDTTRKFTGS